MPDMITIAKGLTNGVIPMGAVLVHEEIYQAYMHKDAPGIELFHGYTYSGHPVAAAAAAATWMCTNPWIWKQPWQRLNHNLNQPYTKWQIVPTLSI